MIHTPGGGERDDGGNKEANSTIVSESHNLSKQKRSVCQDSFPLPLVLSPHIFGGGVMRCPKQIKDYFDLIKIFLSFMCVWLAWEMGQ